MGYSSVGIVSVYIECVGAGVLMVAATVRQFHVMLFWTLEPSQERGEPNISSLSISMTKLKHDDGEFEGDEDDVDDGDGDPNSRRAQSHTYIVCMQTT